MTLGAECLGDRVANWPLLSGVPAGLDGGADAGRVHLEGLGKPADGGGPGLLDQPVAQKPDGTLVYLGPSCQGQEGQAGQIQQVLQSLGPLATHGCQSLPEESGRIHGVALDFHQETSDTAHVKNAPTVANFSRRATAEAGPEPAKEPAMETTTTLQLTPQQSSALRLARETLDRLGEDFPRTAAALAAAIDALDHDAIDDETYTARRLLGDYCSRRGCGAELAEPAVDDYCSRRCFDRDGGGL